MGLTAMAIVQRADLESRQSFDVARQREVDIVQRADLESRQSLHRRDRFRLVCAAPKRSVTVCTSENGERSFGLNMSQLTGRSQRATLRVMLEIRKTSRFAIWLDGLDDIRARARILVRIERLAAGHAGDAKPVGKGVSELRIDCGPGYRVYFKRVGRQIVVLLAGGDKRTQAQDIRMALALAKNL
jgi:putative addiction module killer protein